MQGIVCVNKQKGWTSFDVVKKIKKIFNTSKVGHLGTLDPMAEGVLPVAIGKATKLFDYYLKKTKSYKAEFEFGYETDTLDIEGEVINTSNKIPTMQEINNVLPKLTGKIMQVPPKYSAIKINGQRAYALARKDIDFEPAAKEVEITKIECIERLSDRKYSFLIECSAGTYIRSIARDLAKLLSTFATMTKLIRTRSGNFSLDKSFTMQEIEEEKAAAIIPINTVLADLPRIQISEDRFSLLLNGVKIKVKNCQQNALSTIYVKDTLFGIGKVVNDLLEVEVRLYEGETK